jgi:outer membrane protein assembly factor BamE (lipoprotein component of BamABCDE complex)
MLSSHFIRLPMMLRSFVAAATAVLLLAACDEQRIAKLEEGVSTETQVRQQFGEPVTVVTLADGSRVFEYPRQPEGWTNYFITLGSDGTMSALRQVLTEANFARVATGMAQHEVRALLGRPARTQRFELKQEEVWDWRFRTGPNGQLSRVFSATFDRDGRVTTTAIGDDPRQTQVGGN